jgi:hypothetical protein
VIVRQEYRLGIMLGVILSGFLVACLLLSGLVLVAKSLIVG